MQINLLTIVDSTERFCENIYVSIIRVRIKKRISSCTRRERFLVSEKKKSLIVCPLFLYSSSSSSSSSFIASVDSQPVHARPLRVTVIRVHGKAHAIGRANYLVLAKRKRRHAIRDGRVKREVSKLLVSPRHLLNVVIVAIVASATFLHFRKHTPGA